MANQLLTSAENYLKRKASGSPIVSSVKKPTFSPSVTAPPKPSLWENVKNFAKAAQNQGIIGFGGVPAISKGATSTVIDPVAGKISQLPAFASTAKFISERTNWTGMSATIKSVSPEVTFQQAYTAMRESQAKNDDKFQEKFLTQLKDSAPQTAIGVMLNFLPGGKALSSTYWAMLSAGSQIEEKGKVYSLNDIGIDVIGDSMLGSSIESLFKKPAKTLVKTITKTFITEGGTEVAQDMLKMANDYSMAKNQKERDSIMASAKEYITSGQILITAGVGGIIGAGIGTITHATTQTPIIIQNNIKLYESQGMTHEAAVRKATQGGFAKVPKTYGELTKAKQVQQLQQEISASQEALASSPFNNLSKKEINQLLGTTDKTLILGDKRAESLGINIQETGSNDTVLEYEKYAKAKEILQQTKEQLKILKQKDISFFEKQNKGELLPTVIKGDTFVLGTETTSTPQQAKVTIRKEIRATQKEARDAVKAQEKALKLDEKKQQTRLEAIQEINRQRGKTEKIIAALKGKFLSDEDINNIVLENGVKLVEVDKIKRNPDKSLATVILKEQVDRIEKNYTGKKPTQKWVKANKVKDLASGIVDVAKKYSLPAILFENKGLGELFDKNLEGQRAAEYMKTEMLNKFKAKGLFKRGGFFTADGFTISTKESKNIAKYYLSRQGIAFYGQPIQNIFTNLSEKEKLFVLTFDEIIADTEERFFQTAQTLGKTPGKVPGYAPIMTREDIKLADEGGAADWLFRKHPAFFSLKERVEHVPPSLYELDYRKVMARWIDGMSTFLNTAEINQDMKYLVESDEFRDIVSAEDHTLVTNWLKDITTPPKITTIEKGAGFFRKTAAIAALGLNYASVIKQSLTQLPIMIIAKARPKLGSSYAKAFGINVSDMPSITKRSGDIAITDLQGKLGRIFTGSITEFDRANAQFSLSGLLDKEYNKVLKSGVPITDETHALIQKKAQDALDLWYGGFFKGQKPEMFRSQVGNFFNMFIYPLTSQLNGFYRHIYQTQGMGAKTKAAAEVAVTAVLIAYLEQVITKLSLKWDDEKDMAGDVLQSLAGNIPVLSQLVYSFATDQQIQISAGLTSLEYLRRMTAGYIDGQKDLIDVFFATGEVLGVPKSIRRFYEGMEIIQDGGILDKEGKRLVPVQEADEIIRSFLRGKYGSLAAQDWVTNLKGGDDRRWYVPAVEFLQNGDYERKAELYINFSPEERENLKQFLSKGQIDKLTGAVKEYYKKQEMMPKIKQKLSEKGIIDEKKQNEAAEAIYKQFKMTPKQKKLETIKNKLIEKGITDEKKLKELSEEIYDKL